MSAQVPLSSEAIAELVHPDDGTTEIAPDLAYRRLAMVNVVFVGSRQAGDGDWVLVDAGVAGLRGRITKAAVERFGGSGKPAAIVLTHGHFDHVGCLEDLLAEWNVPVYAHALEAPYLNGSAAYPAPDPLVGGGIMPLLAPLFPRRPIDVSQQLRILPADGSIPPLPGWQWLHTPGHSAGHISLWREADRTLIAGDAFITTNQESAYAVAVQSPEMHGPPRYFTPDWEAARASVQRLATLEPRLAVTGHGRAMQGAEMRASLHTLADNFDAIAVPPAGKYVGHPARAEDGTAYVQP